MSWISHLLAWLFGVKTKEPCKICRIIAEVKEQMTKKSDPIHAKTKYFVAITSHSYIIWSHNEFPRNTVVVIENPDGDFAESSFEDYKTQVALEKLFSPCKVVATIHRHCGCHQAHTVHEPIGQTELVINPSGRLIFQFLLMEHGQAEYVQVHR